MFRITGITVQDPGIRVHDPGIGVHDGSESVFRMVRNTHVDFDLFNSREIEARFQRFTHPVYAQLHGQFLSHMAALDLLFNHGPNSLEILMEGQDTLADGSDSGISGSV